MRRDGANGRSATSDSRYNLSDIQVKGAWSGPARLVLVPHVNAPVADLPVR
ncbi:acetoacetate decarboxylase family protein [Caballeronia grimmiae]|uniref:acetoacetate decarboxylase family protein n=1 Tax=Caballeronia grimmiae TaxID=1071679 RepID=UPI003530A6E2